MSFIKFDNVSFSYRDCKPVIKKAKFDICRGDFVALVGPNGSGKTTLGKLVMGILKADRGKIYIDGSDVKNMSLGQVGKKIGYLFQNPEVQIFALTVEEELSFAMRIKNIPDDTINDRVKKVLEYLGLSHQLHSPTYNLSYGEKQRLAIAGILVNEPDFIILDEPTTGLDVIRENMLIKILKSFLTRGIGLMVISHDIFFIKKFTGRILKIYGGEIFEQVSG